MQLPYLIIALLSGLIVLSALVSMSDYRYRRIPNQYLVWASAYALVIYLIMFCLLPFTTVIRGFLMSLLGIVASGMFFYLPYKYRQVGAGDVKLAMVFGLFLGFKGAILAILLGAMVGGIWALALAWKYGGLGHMWYNIKYMATSMYLSGFKEMNWDLRSAGAIAMPYGVALSIGAALIAIEQLFIQLEYLQH